MRTVWRAVGPCWCLLLLVGPAGCATTKAPKETTGVQAPFEYVGRVESVKPLVVEHGDLKPWSVVVKVVRVLSNEAHADVQPGQSVEIRVHSVIRSFSDDVDTVPGKSYCFYYADGFYPVYHGRLKVRPADGSCPYPDEPW